MKDSIKQVICEAVCDKKSSSKPWCHKYENCHWHKKFEQTFRDAGWIESQQMEGELVPNPHVLTAPPVKDDICEIVENCLHYGFKEGSLAQYKKMVLSL